MPWSEITLIVPNSLKDAVTGELASLGAAGIWERGEPTAGDTKLAAYFEPTANLDQVRNAMAFLFQRTGMTCPTLELAIIKDQDWGEEWKKAWTSFPMGDRFFVIPSWEHPSCPPQRTPIHIDPGQAFGTGTHETTQLTLEAMERWIASGAILLDLGTGSGILAIAATHLGAKHVFACDTDPVAVDVARENLERNSAQTVGLLCASIDAVADAAIDFLVCNLTADVITTTFSDIHRALRADGISVFSGILRTQAGDVRQAAGKLGHRVLEQTNRGEWCALVTRKNGR
jgi:ribosomal protein L11 methyltransferase